MKYAIRLLSLLLAGLMLCGCVQNQAQKPYVPTGDALLMEGEDPEDYAEEDAPQELTLAYYPDRSMNPLIGNNITNRSLFSLIYQGLFRYRRTLQHLSHPVLPLSGFFGQQDLDHLH